MRCDVCGQPSHAGNHRLAATDAEQYPLSDCPKCSGGGREDSRAKCVVGDRAHYRCSCGLVWSGPASTQTP